jgi:hypothetical protein
MLLLFIRRAIGNNGLRAREGRETNALNFKPNTNLNEKYELSNFSKTSGFILHAVSGCSAHSVHQNTNCSHFLFGAGFGGVSRMNVIN